MRRLLERAIADERGGTAVELALTVTVFMAVVLGGVDYGLYLWTANALQQTAIQTARCMGVLASGCVDASRAYSSANTAAFAQGVAAGYGLTLPTSAVAPNAVAGCGGQGTDNSSVTLSYTFTGIAPGLLPGIKSSSMSAQACFPNQT